MKPDRQTLINTAFDILHSIAPEIEAAEIDLTQALRQQVDLDSMDWLNFLLGLHERLGVDIAESDYIRLISLNDVVDYIQARLGNEV
ncbi:MAG: phosphopantetheine-binding protein [Undibacterium sp.]|jgi:acyl carrier protein|uniref:acyl carrier protein n=1 Tax=Undibacterium sp. TaxID=1914977 RepID=UPI0027165A83|nr:phosphopantetheine-binding protein [Undibacterium sp.]MDO8653937.1 phosphopantetheine-binding protein [Undibacterium sp.]